MPECRICKADESLQSVRADHVYGGRPTHNFWQCDRCSGIYLYPPLSEKEEAYFYKKEFEGFMDRRSGQDRDWKSAHDHIRTNQDQVRRRWAYLKPHMEKGMELLEIGCSSGFMLNQFKNFGLKCTGVEPSGAFLPFLKKNGYQAFSDLKELQETGRPVFDRIVHFFVLEHIRNPFDFFEQTYGMLKPGGKIIAEVPCADDPLTSVYTIPEFEKFYWSIAHHYYFNRKSMTYILDKAGYDYELIPEQRYDLSNHMTWMMTGMPGGQGAYGHIFSPELNQSYKNDLKTKWLCDTMIVIISK